MLAILRWPIFFGLCVGLGCVPPPKPSRPTVLRRATPPPPGSVIRFGPLRVGSVQTVRHEVGWLRDHVEGQRLVVYDVVLTQPRATCPEGIFASKPGTETMPQLMDSIGCSGIALPASGCSVELLQARIEVVVTNTVTLRHRCLGETSAWALPPGDARATILSQAITCFRTKNKGKAETAWAPIYEIVELSLAERVTNVESNFEPTLLALLKSENVGSGAPNRFCRDDGAYLDGTAGAERTSSADGRDEELGKLLGERAKLHVKDIKDGHNLSTPITDSFRSEHTLWAACNTSDVKFDVPVQERCQLLRHFDRLLAEAEDVARPETPKGPVTWFETTSHLELR